MKILVNSKYIASAFKTALEVHSDEVILMYGDNLSFIGGERTHEYNVHVLEKSENVYLERVSLYRAYKFISQLEEQPIVVEISYDQIELSQFVKRFIDNKL